MTEEELKQWMERSQKLYAFGTAMPPGADRDLVVLSAGALMGFASRLFAECKRR